MAGEVVHLFGGDNPRHSRIAELLRRTLPQRFDEEELERDLTRSLEIAADAGSDPVLSLFSKQGQQGGVEVIREALKRVGLEQSDEGAGE